MKSVFFIAVVSFLLVSCGSQVRRIPQNDDSISASDKAQADEVQGLDDENLSDESEDETVEEKQDEFVLDEITDEEQDDIIPDDIADETQDITFSDDSVDELQDEIVDEAPDEDSCVDECYEGIISCNGDDLMKCVKVGTGCTVEVLDIACANVGQECEQLIGGAHCVNPEVELDLGSVGGNPTTRTADHQMKGNRFTMKSTVRLTRFSYALRPMEDQDFTFFVYVDEGSYNWTLIYASAPLAVTTETEAKYYESPAIDIPLEKDKEYAIGLFFDKEVQYVYKSGDAGDFGTGNHWGLFSKGNLPNDVHTPPDTTDSEVYNDYTYAMKLYYR